ncbi:MAG: glycosyltransferase family 4 protein [Caldilineaceae bacterium]|nr:glycosyltransferase family 4 protein [Caldilineaceae bacterium]
MRILVLTWEYPPYVVGGMGKHVAGLVPELGGIPSRYGPVIVDVVTTRYGGGPAVEPINPYVTVHRVDVAQFDPLDLYNQVITSNDALVAHARQLAEQTPYDLIHVHDWLPGVASIILKHGFKTPLVATVHATERGRHQGHLDNNTSRQIDTLEWKLCYESWHLIVCSQYMTNEVYWYFGAPHGKISVIPNGIAATQLHACAPEQLDELRAAYAPRGERLLFYVGRITYEKGLHVLLRAMPHILRDHPTTRLLVAGKNSRHYLPLATELGVSQSVRFLDYISDAQRDCLYQVVDAAIFPSLYEPFGIVALEAMAQNCNVIASDVGGLGEVVEHLVNGLTVYPNDPESIAWAVRTLFANPAAAEQRRITALRQMEEHYNWSTIARQTVTLFERVVEERRQTPW